MARTSRSRSSSGESTTPQPAEPAASRQRREPYLIAPRTLFHGGALGVEALAERLAALPDVDAVEVVSPARAGGDGIVLAHLGARRVESLRAEAGAQLLIEPDQLLTCSTVDAAGALECHDPGVATPHGLGFSTRVRVTGAKAAGSAPVAGAVVQLFGRIWSAGAITDDDGEAVLTIYGEAPDTIAGLLVQPRTGFWSRWLRRPALVPDDTLLIDLAPLEAAPDGPLGWGQRAMGLERLPAHWRGHGVKLALVDSGIAPGHRALSHVVAGIDIAGRAEQGWRRDDTGHGTHAAGIIAARGDDADPAAIRGFAPDAELLVCRIFPDGRLSDLVRALDCAIEQAVDLISLGAGCAHGSQIVERRIAQAKQAGIACIAAAGNSTGRVDYPAASPHVLAVAALGRAGSYPRDSYHATQSIDGREGAAGDGLFAARFSCHGPEIDVAAPGVAVISCAPPDDLASVDGTSAACAHVAGLAALLLAHHPDFRGPYATRGAARVERLFQIIKATAQPLLLGDPGRTGAGLPDVARALNLAATAESVAPRRGAATAALGDVRDLMRQAGLLDRAAGDTDDDALEPVEPPDPTLRGPAVTGFGPLSWSVVPMGNGGGAPTLEALRAAMADAALL